MTFTVGHAIVKDMKALFGMFVLLFSISSYATLEVSPISAHDLLANVRAGSSKFTLVNIWATWCAPCKEEMPELLTFAKTHASDVRLILVSADSPEDTTAAKEFLASAGVAQPEFRLSENPEDFAKRFAPRWSATLPTTFVFDSKGRQITFWVGKTTKSELETKLRAAFKPRLAKP